MAGGISEVLDRLKARKNRVRDYTDQRTGAKVNEYRCKRKAYEGVLWTGARGNLLGFELRHYGTLILHIKWKHRKVEDGWSQASSSSAINQALSTFDVPCRWSRAKSSYGFWCDKPWKGSPDGETIKKRRAEERELEKRRNKAVRRLEQPGGIFRIPGHRYSPYARKKMAELQEEYQRLQRLRHGEANHSEE